MPWLQARGDERVIALHVQPGAKRTEVAGLHGEALKIRLAAVPVDGKANEALIGFLAARLGIPKAWITLLSGQTSRSKRVAVAGLSCAQIKDRMAG